MEDMTSVFHLLNQLKLLCLNQKSSMKRRRWRLATTLGDEHHAGDLEHVCENDRERERDIADSSSHSEPVKCVYIRKKEALI